MWHWQFIWKGDDGEFHTLTSERGWDTQMEAVYIMTSIEDFVVARLYDLGITDITDIQVIYKAK